MPKYRGTHRITVTGVQAEWPQRAVVTVRGGGTVVVPGVLGASEVIDAEDWDLAVEHEYQNTWGPSIRAVVGRWEERGGTRSQVVRCTDRDRLGSPGGRSLVLRIDQEDPQQRAAAPESASAARWSATESAAGQQEPSRGGGRISTSGADAPSSRPSGPSTTSGGYTTASGSSGTTSGGYNTTSGGW
ncbi:hypothetical protein ACFVVX_34010 [Kitasatospora sp. NPDC058170]|uniref:hypothetical protein n=1 Tax=Kitasatospora sp. NPDC058170 TaxID=3346364 RepID=UPI0036DF9C23